MPQMIGPFEVPLRGNPEKEFPQGMCKTCGTVYNQSTNQIKGEQNEITNP
jgi:hypothetical protein